jgi:DNA-binding CsgD family transcriptional regulator
MPRPTRGDATSAAIIGRQAELEALTRFVEGAGARTTGLFLEGPAGIGKTRLWEEGLALARDQGRRVLATRPGGADVRLAFAGIADLLAGTLGVVLPQLPAPQRRALEAALLLAAVAGAPPDDRAIAAAFLSTIRLVAAESPLVVAVDDVQWLDAASLRVLEFAFRRLEDERAILLATMRIAPEEHEPIELVRALRDRLARLPVGPLSVAATYELVRTRLDLSVSRSTLLRLHEASGGKPFFALELARALQRAGVDPRSHEPLPIPAVLRDVVRGRLAELPAAVRETLLYASALTRPTVRALEDAVGRRASGDLEAAVEAGIVELDGEGVRFAHPLLASIHYGGAARARRRKVHGRLAMGAADVEERARHLALAAPEPHADVAAELDAAARRARSRGALTVAADLAERALVATPAGDAERSHRRRLAAAEFHYAAGDTAQAAALIEHALREAVSGRGRAELLWSLGKIKLEGEDTRVGAELFRRALADDGADDALRARILADLSLSIHDGYEAAAAHASAAADLAERLGDDETLARALARLGTLLFFSGQGFRPKLFERAVELEDALGGLELDYGPTMEYARTLGHVEIERPRPLLERLCERGRASGDATVTHPLCALSGLECETGHWERARELAREAHTVALQSGREAAESRGLIALARVEAWAGEVASARAAAEQALVITRSRGWQSRGPFGVLGFLDLSLENYETAYDALAYCVDRNQALGSGEPNDQLFDAIEALVGLGRLGEAHDLLAVWEPRSLERAWAVPRVARSRGLIAAAEGDLESAEAALEEAVDTGEPVGIPQDLGRSLLALGTIRRRRRRKQAAREALERALAIFEALGARVYAERTRRELGRIGGRAPSGAQLTATEERIVELVSQGLTNKEVGSLLVVSHRTVEGHLSRIFTKLGLRSRGELIGRFARAK